MKKTALLIIFFLFSPFVLHGEQGFLNLRSSNYPDFLRIVVEGPEPLISSAIVNQKTKEILVTFSGSNFVIKAEDLAVSYRKAGQDAIMFFPENFRGLKVFTLKNPSRLVIDVYKDTRISTFPPSDYLIRKKKEKEASGIRTVIIDPGHGGYENGVVLERFREKNVVLDIARKLAALINRRTAQSFLTRSSDRFMSQGERVEIANSNNSDVFISLHIGNHEGIIIYVPVITEDISSAIKPYLSNKGQEKYMKDTEILLNALQKAFTENLGEGMVTVRTLSYSFLSKIEAASLMIELPSFEHVKYAEALKEDMAGTLLKGLFYYEEIRKN